MTQVGKKFDGGKLRFTLFPIEALNPILRVLEFGAKKYGEHNWRYVEGAEGRYANALHRHFLEWLDGKENDEETGESVLANLATNAIFLLALEMKNRGAGPGKFAKEIAVASAPPAPAQGFPDAVPGPHKRRGTKGAPQ